MAIFLPVVGGTHGSDFPDAEPVERNPGGWGYNVLPFIEEKPLHEMGMGDDPKARRAGSARRLQTVVEIFYCPTRREARLYPAVTGHTRNPRETDPVDMVARNDYASNSGDRFADFNLGPTTLAQGDDPGYNWPSMKQMTGLMHMRSQVRIEQVVDGTSKTYFVGEKYLNPENYANGRAYGDNEAVFMGAGQDLNRWTTVGLPPMRDTPGVNASTNFGSAHVTGLNMMFCDGSVRHIPFRIEPEMHRRFGNRKDGLSVDTTVLE